MEGQFLYFEKFRLDLRTGELLQEDRRVRLPPQPTKLLLLLARSPGTLVSHEEIQKELWGGDTFVDFEQAVKKCVKQVRSALGDEAEQPVYVETVPRRGYRFIGPLRVEGGELSPYPGLSEFLEKDAKFFFGRKGEAEALWNKIDRRKLLGLIGPSGSGKSSFLRAGLLPSRRKGWRVEIVNPGNSALASLPDRDRENGPYLLIVDAFEELFTRNPPEVQKELSERLGFVAREKDGHVLLSMRDDFLFRCHEQESLQEVFFDLTPLGPLTGAALTQALEKPAAASGYRFEDGLVEEIVREVEKLPLLAFAAAQLWEKRDREKKVLTRAAYEEIGRVGEALAQHAERTLQSIGPERQSTVREIFRNLTTSQGTRASLGKDELLSIFPDREMVGVVLARLIDARLLISSESGIEIAHESLLAAWPRLTQWQAQDAEGTVLRDQLRQAARAWQERGRREDLLWTGTSYRELGLWRERYGSRLTASEEEFAAAAANLAGRRLKRLRDIDEARIAIHDRIAGRSDDGAVAPRPLWPRAVPWTMGALGLVVGLAGLALRGPGPSTETRELAVSRFEIVLPADAPLVPGAYPARSLALSHDGTQIVYVTDDAFPGTRLRLRRLDEIEIRSLPGTEDGRGPFFSPDGEWLAYFDEAELALKKVSLRGGRPVTLARGFPEWFLGCWCDDGRIVFDTWNAGLRVVDEEGADLRVLTEPTEEWHLDPQPLPGPCRVLFYTHGNEGQTIEAISVDSGERTRILENASHGRFLASGHLLFVRDGALHGVPFDAERLKVTGAAVVLPIDPLPDAEWVAAPNPQLAVSLTGTLVYAPNEESAAPESPLVAVTLDGRAEELGPLPFTGPMLALSPDGETLALAGRRAGDARIVALDLRRRASTTLVDRGGFDGIMTPLWTPDGKAILYARFGPFEGEIVRHELAGGASDRVLRRVPGTWLVLWSISPDGRFLVVSRYVPETGADLLLLDLEADPNAPEAARPLIATPTWDSGGTISPNGEWLAYIVDESGSPEVLIEKFPERGQKTRVWSGAFDAPVWSPDGRELYFMVPSAGGGGGHDVMAVRVELAPTLRVSEPRRLFSGFFAGGGDLGRRMALTPDGRRFLIVRSNPGAPGGGYQSFATRLIVVQNWFSELRRERGERSLP